MTNPQPASVEVDLPGSAPALALAIVPGTGLKASVTGHVVLLGWSLHLLSATAGANVAIYTGGAPGGQVLAYVDTAADPIIPMWAGPGGIDAPAGLYVYVNTASVQGVVYFRPVT